MPTTEAETIDEAPTGACGCTHWIDVFGDIPLACDLAPHEHETNPAGYTIHETYWDGGAEAVGIGDRIVAKDSHPYHISWVDTSDVARKAVEG